MTTSSVKEDLTPKSRTHQIESDEYAAFVHRTLRAYARRVGDGDLAALPDFLALRDLIDELSHEAVSRLRQEPWNYSWAEIARVLGRSRQAVQERFADPGGSRRPGGQPGQLR